VSGPRWAKHYGEDNGNFRHGMSESPEYRAWVNARRRCYDRSYEGYHRYGGRGIIVCKRWLGSNGFKNFFIDMGLRPSSKHSLERKNNNKNYSPKNCVWATAKEQGRNRCNNVTLTVRGESKTMSAWAEEKGLPRTLISLRLSRGKSHEEAVLTPTRVYLRKDKHE
jgi:hypothetical protein